MGSSGPPNTSQGVRFPGTHREECLQQPWLQVEPVPADGPIAKFIVEELVPSGRSPAHEGELQCIGVAHHLKVPFSTADKNGFIIGAATLGSSQVMLPYDLWLALETAGYLSGIERAALSKLTWKNHRQLVLRQPARTRQL